MRYVREMLSQAAGAALTGLASVGMSVEPRVGAKSRSGDARSSSMESAFGPSTCTPIATFPRRMR